MHRARAFERVEHAGGESPGRGMNVERHAIGCTLPQGNGEDRAYSAGPPHIGGHVVHETAVDMRLAVEEHRCQ